MVSLGNNDFYTNATVDSPVLLALIHSRAIQRLKKIGQSGQPQEIETRHMGTRFDHSIGVMLLLQKLHASEEEMIAGLLHDVSHTAFSHTIDLIVNQGTNEDFQDKNHKEYMLKSDIPQILKEYGYRTERIYDYHHFTLLEQEIPDICADRVDYSLRELPKVVAKRCLDNIIVHKKKMVFSDQDIAREFALGFLSLQEKNWGYEENVIREHLFARFLMLAIKKNIVTLADFWGDDLYVMKKIHQVDDKELEKILAFIKQPRLKDLPKSDMIIHKKFRHVNPQVLMKGNLFRLSTIDETFKQELELARTRNTTGILLPIIDF